MQNRYERNLGFFSEGEQSRLASSHAAIIGAGGLGGVVFEILLRAGVGEISIADFDSFDETNLNRQLLSSEENLGRSKVEEAARRAVKINSSCKVNAIHRRVDSSNAVQLIHGANCVIDCTDSIGGRFEIELAASTLPAPLVHAAVAGSLGQITTIFPGEKTMEAIYGPRENAPEKGEETSLGAPAPSVFFVASVQAYEALCVLSGRAPALHGKLLRSDLKTFTSSTFKI